MSVCEDEYATVLRSKLLLINRRWKEVTESVHYFKHDESIKSKREEFYTGRGTLLETLERIEREMHEFLPCTTKALQEQENRLGVSAISLLSIHASLVSLECSGRTRDVQSDDPDAR